MYSTYATRDWEEPGEEPGRGLGGAWEEPGRRLGGAWEGFTPGTEPQPRSLVPGLYLLQYLITSSVQKWREMVWEVSSHAMSGRQRVDTRVVVIQTFVLISPECTK